MSSIRTVKKHHQEEYYFLHFGELQRKEIAQRHSDEQSSKEDDVFEVG
jgi:hypothetical protein